jgi:hypothetical protein
VYFPAHAGNYAQMVDYFAAVFHVSTIVLKINKNISKGAESRINVYIFNFYDPIKC